MGRIAIIFILAFSLGDQISWAQRPIPIHQGHVPPPPEPDTEKLTDAERISKLQRGIDEAQAQLDALRTKLNDPKSEYKSAEAEFAEIDARFEESRKELAKARAEGAADLDPKESAHTESEKRRNLARERFDLAIRERKALQDQIVALEQKLVHDREALAKLSGVNEGKKAGAAEPKPVSPTSTTATPPTVEPGQPPSALPASEAQAPPKEAAPTTDPAAIVNPLSPATTTAPPAPATATTEKPDSEKIVKAKEAASTKQAEADEAKKEAVSLTERLESIRKVIESEKELRRTARQKADNARATYKALGDESNQKLASGIPYSQLGELTDKIIEADKRTREADAEIVKHDEVIEARQRELDSLQKEQIAALEQAKKKMEEAEKARAALEKLQNPFAPENIWNWLVKHGPKIGFTVLLAVFLLWFAGILEPRMVRLITQHGVAGTADERENRARTLVGVLQNAFTVVVVVGAFLIVLAEAGFNINALLGATAVIGLAVAFGAQNLIRDYFYGFMILMENQYLVNDVVRLGSISGQVERITLRITVLRDLHGTVHFVPHGQITTVSNLTRGWARVVLDVGVAYKEDVDRVMKVLADLGKELRRDPVYRDLVLDEPEISGVDLLGDSAVVIRFLIKTRPQKQWVVKREMLRRIKNKFDELAIEIPFPHQTVYNRFDPKATEQPQLFSPRASEGEEWKQGPDLDA